jgi:hypothetical protein
MDERFCTGFGDAAARTPTDAGRIRKKPVRFFFSVNQDLWNCVLTYKNEIFVMMWENSNAVAPDWGIGEPHLAANMGNRCRRHGQLLQLKQMNIDNLRFF